MKKFLTLLYVFALSFSIVGCTIDNDANDFSDEGGAEIAMITDIGTIDDKSFNQGVWQGIVDYCENNKITHEYYKPSEQNCEAYLSAIELAVDNGAKVIVTPGYLFEEPIYKAQYKYPDVHFILIDGKPHNSTYKKYKTNKNTVGILFAEEQSGYLAGYAAVKDGYRKLGFMGGKEITSVKNFGHGFVQGANDAAKELNIENVDIKYHYSGGFDATPEVQTLAQSWYKKGTEVIFACGGSVGNSVMAAAESLDNKKVIGVDVDQSGDSATVITSAMKSLSFAVTETLDEYYNGKFPGGKTITLGADKQGVELPMNTSRFKKFTQEDYDKIYKDLAEGKIKIDVKVK